MWWRQGFLTLADWIMWLPVGWPGRPSRWKRVLQSVLLSGLPSLSRVNLSGDSTLPDLFSKITLLYAYSDPTAREVRSVATVIIINPMGDSKKVVFITLPCDERYSHAVYFLVSLFFQLSIDCRNYDCWISWSTWHALFNLYTMFLPFYTKIFLLFVTLHYASKPWTVIIHDLKY